MTFKPARYYKTLSRTAAKKTSNHNAFGEPVAISSCGTNFKPLQLWQNMKKARLGHSLGTTVSYLMDFNDTFPDICNLNQEIIRLIAKRDANDGGNADLKSFKRYLLNRWRIYLLKDTK